MRFTLFWLLALWIAPPTTWSAAHFSGEENGDPNIPHHIQRVLTQISENGADLAYQPEHIQQAVHFYITPSAFPEGFDESDLPGYITDTLQTHIQEESVLEIEWDALMRNPLTQVRPQVGATFSTWIVGPPPLDAGTIGTYLDRVRAQGTQWLTAQFESEHTILMVLQGILDRLASVYATEELRHQTEEAYEIGQQKGFMKTMMVHGEMMKCNADKRHFNASLKSAHEEHVLSILRIQQSS